MLLVSIPIPGNILTKLLLDVGGLGVARRQRSRRGPAKHGLQLRVAQGEAQQGDGEAVDEEKGGDVAAGQHLKEGGEAVNEEAQADGGEDGPERDALDAETICLDVTLGGLRCWGLGADQEWLCWAASGDPVGGVGSGGEERSERQCGCRGR